jgi:cell shape-determining protein MreD
MRNIVAFPLLLLVVILQTAVASQVKLLSGYADLMLLVLGAWALQKRVKSAWLWAALGCAMLAFVSNMPWPVLVIGYFGVVFVAQVLQKRVWQAPLLAMFSVVFIGTLFLHLLSFIALSLLGTPFVFGDVIGLITLPSLLLNMLFSIPIYAFMRDLARWVYPAEEYE